MRLRMLVNLRGICDIDTNGGRRRTHTQLPKTSFVDKSGVNGLRNCLIRECVIAFSPFLLESLVESNPDALGRCWWSEFTTEKQEVPLHRTPF